MNTAHRDTQPPDPLATVNGFVTTSYFGGRTESRLRRLVMPTTYLDFASMYGSCNCLMGHWELLTAERIRVVDATNGVRRFLATTEADDLFDPATWHDMGAIVQVLPGGDVLPTRTRYGDETYATYGIGVNPLTSDRPLWYTLPDCLAAKLRTSKAPQVLRALRFVPEGKQQLRPVQLRGQVAIDGNVEDFFRQALVERRKVKQGQPPYDTLSATERGWLQQFVKTVVNASAYGIYMQMDRQDGQTARVRAYGLTTVEQEITGPEKLGPFCLPLLATLITGGARLMLELAAHEVRRLGGQYALMDTDSLAVVSIEHGSLLPGPGGPLRLPDGQEAIRALSWAEVEAISARFRALNPYGDGDSILEFEDENYAPCTCGKRHKSAKSCTGERQQLYAYSIASKRYALFNLAPSGEVALRGIADGDDSEEAAPIDNALDELGVRKYSQHGLGAYEKPRDPATGKPVEKWERSVWEYLIRRALGQPVELPAWAHQTALTQVRIARPEQLRWFDAFNRTAKEEEKPYAERVKPFNFLSHAMPKPLTALPDGITADCFCLVAPAGERQRFVNRHEPKGRVYTAGVDFTPKTYADLIEAYDLHPERKFAGPDGQPCRPGTRGLLQDLPLIVAGIRHVGKEGNALEAHKAGIITERERQLEYHDSAFDDLIAKLSRIDTRIIAAATGYNPRTVRRLKRGEFQPSAEKLAMLQRLIPS